jgi:hypothetical protein
MAKTKKEKQSDDCVTYILNIRKAVCNGFADDEFSGWRYTIMTDTIESGKLVGGKVVLIILLKNSNYKDQEKHQNVKPVIGSNIPIKGICSNLIILKL